MLDTVMRPGMGRIGRVVSSSFFPPRLQVLVKARRAQ